MVIDIKKYILSKLILPKTLIIDRPGIIINKTTRRYGKESVRTRIIYHFEDIAINLYSEVLKKLGKEKADFLWYKIGKEAGTRYFLFVKRRKMPSLLMPLIIKHIFRTFDAAGMSFARDIFYNKKKKFLVTNGRNCAICRKTKSGDVMAGITSGILSSLLKENIEAEVRCTSCPDKCKIVASPQIPRKYVPNFKELAPLKDYDRLNIPTENGQTNLKSFTDLLKFKKIRINGQNGSFYFQNKMIVPSEIGLPGIISKNYIEIGEKNLFKKTVINTSENIIHELFGELNFQDKIKAIRNMVSAFGLGIMYLKKIKNTIILDFINPPITKFGPMFRAFILNGYINAVYDKKFGIKELTNKRIELIM